MPGVEFASLDMSQVKVLAGELRTVRSRLRPAMRRATGASAKNIRDNARRAWTGHGKTRTYPRTITFEYTKSNATMVSAEIGPEKGGIGSLGHIFEFGSAKSPPKPHLVPAWLAEDGPYQMALADAAQRAVLPP